MKFLNDILIVFILCAILLGVMTPSGSARFERTMPSLGGPGTSQLTPPTSFPKELSLEAAPPSGYVDPEIFHMLSKMGRIAIGFHAVQPKETLASIAKQYDTGFDYLRSSNRLESTNLSMRKTLVVHNGKGMLHKVSVRKGKLETLSEIARRYNQSKESIVRANRLPGLALLADGWIEAGQVLFIPNAKLRFIDYDLPVAWARGKRFLSSGFGMRRHPILGNRTFHRGWDLPRPHGFPVKASREGK
ncbi:MAG TPA: M23 family metallopeptidase, partial [Elusimicrobiota bacterium]|nr:M23 family metallopeptidase [Elusimicrobiota bacterium]